MTIDCKMLDQPMARLKVPILWFSMLLAASVQPTKASSGNDSSDLVDAKSRLNTEMMELTGTAYAEDLRPQPDDWLALTERHFGDQLGELDPITLDDPAFDALYSVNLLLLNRTHQQEFAKRLIILTQELKRRRLKSDEGSPAYRGRHSAENLRRDDQQPFFRSRASGRGQFCFGGAAIPVSDCQLDG